MKVLSTFSVIPGCSLVREPSEGVRFPTLVYTVEGDDRLWASVSYLQETNVFKDNLYVPYPYFHLDKEELRQHFYLLDPYEPYVAPYITVQGKHLKKGTPYWTVDTPSLKLQDWIAGEENNVVNLKYFLRYQDAKAFIEYHTKRFSLADLDQMGLVVPSTFKLQ